MKLSKERKLFLGILGLGLVALATDQLLLAPTAVVAAAEGVTIEALEQEAAEATPTASAAKPETPRAKVGPSFALRLVGAAGKRDMKPDVIRDGFAPGAAWKIETAIVEKAEAPPASAAKRFVDTCRPQLVLRAAGCAIVKIGGKHYRVGDSIEGRVIAAIGRRSVTFVNGTESVEVPLPEATASNAPSRAPDNGRP